MGISFTVNDGTCTKQDNPFKDSDLNSIDGHDLSEIAYVWHSTLESNQLRLKYRLAMVVKKRYFSETKSEPRI